MRTTKTICLVFLLAVFPLIAPFADDSAGPSPWWQQEDGQWCMRIGSGGAANCLPAEIRLRRVSFSTGELTFQTGELFEVPVHAWYQTQDSAADTIAKFLEEDQFLEQFRQQIGAFVVANLTPNRTVNDADIYVSVVFIDSEHSLVIKSVDEAALTTTVQIFVSPR